MHTMHERAGQMEYKQLLLCLIIMSLVTLVMSYCSVTAMSITVTHNERREK